MDAQGFLMLLGDSGICPDVLAENAVTRIFNSGARSQGHLSFEVPRLSRMLAAPPPHNSAGAEQSAALCCSSQDSKHRDRTVN
jgi:hypothetical protein